MEPKNKKKQGTRHAVWSPASPFKGLTALFHELYLIYGPARTLMPDSVLTKVIPFHSPFPVHYKRSVHCVSTV